MANFDLGSILGGNAPYGVNKDDDDELTKLKAQVPSELNSISGLQAEEMPPTVAINNASQEENNDEEDSTPAQKLIATGKKYNASRKPADTNDDEDSAEEAVNKPTISDSIAKLLNGNNEELKQAQNQRNQLQLMAMLGQAGATIGAGMAPLANIQPNQSFYNNLLGAAQQPVKDLTDQREDLLGRLKAQKELNKLDPNAPGLGLQRTLTKQLAKQYDMNIPDDYLNNANQDTLEDVNKILEKAAVAKSNAELKKLNQAALEKFRQDSLTQREKRTDLTANTNVNKLASKEFDPYTSTLDSARTAEGILDKIKKGEIISSKNVAAALQSDITKLLTRSRNTAVYDRAHGEVKALETTWADLASYATSHPRDTIPTAYLDQFSKEIKELKAKTFESFATKTNELSSGAFDQSQENVIKNRFMKQALSHKVNGQKLLDQVNAPLEQPVGYSQDVLDYAQKHGLTPDQAQQIKNKRMGM